ncbi:putative methyltransferase [Minicystis rosea]|nr:putative methyltransferase [Minicystis rosea]
MVIEMNELKTNAGNAGNAGADDIEADSPAKPLLVFLDRVEQCADYEARRRLSYDLLGLRAGSRVADIGCGAGTAVREMAARVAPGGSVAGVDVNAPLIGAAERRAARAGVDAAFHVATVDALPFADASLDAYRAERLYQHLPGPTSAFAEARRVLAPGGRIVLIDQDWDGLFFDSDDLATTRTIVRGFCDGIANGTIGRQYHRLLQDAGFTDVSVHVDVHASTSFDEYGYFAELLTQAAEGSGRLSGLAAEKWLSGQRERGKNGRFFMVMTHFLATGRR